MTEDEELMTHKLLLAVAAVCLAAVAPLTGAPAAGPVTFVAHDIDAGFRGGYAVAVADFNKDGRIDVIANSLGVTELAWYENPTWQKHVIVAEMRQIVNQAMADIDGDGIPEIAFQSAFAMQPGKSVGDNWLARHQGDPRQPWKLEKIDSFPTSHHVAWLDLDGDKRLELLNAPLIGANGLGPTYDQDKASVFWYSPRDWMRHVVADDIPGIIHRVRPVRWDGNARDQFLVASFEGIALYRATGSGASMRFSKQLLSPGHSADKAPRLGASDVGVGAQDGRRFFASVEPWHGNEVVIYTEKDGRWVRRVLFDKIASGHEIAVIDLNGDGRDDVIANDNSRRTPNNPNAAVGGIHVFFAPDDPATGEWQYRKIEEEAAMNGCVGADLNGDRRNDLVCTGSGGVIRWYENKGPAGTGAASPVSSERREPGGVSPDRPGSIAPGDERTVVHVSKEPRHRVVFDSGGVRVQDVQIPAGDTSLYHVHDHALLLVPISRSQTRTQPIGGPWSGGGASRGGGPAATPIDAPPSPPATAGARRVTSTIAYVEKPVTHRVGNVGNGLFRVIAIGNLGKGTENEAEDLLRLGTEPEISDKYYRAYRVSLAAGQSTPPHEHVWPVVVVQQTAGRLAIDGSVKAETSAEGAFAVHEGGTHQVTNSGTTMVEFVEVELRGSSTKK
jgi:hypothetical protein